MSEPTWNPMRQAYDRPPTLAEFLLARWDEDEEVARAAMLPGNYTHYADSAAGECIEMALGEGCSERGTDHWRRHDPARVLAECEAKRRIVTWHTYQDECCEERLGPMVFDAESTVSVGTDSWGGLVTRRSIGHQERLGCVTLMLLALPYADHPDYRGEWRP